MLTAVLSLHMLISLLIPKEPYDPWGCRLVPEGKYSFPYHKANDLAVIKYILCFALKIMQLILIYYFFLFNERDGSHMSKSDSGLSLLNFLTYIVGQP